MPHTPTHDPFSDEAVEARRRLRTIRQNLGPFASALQENDPESFARFAEETADQIGRDAGFAQGVNIADPETFTAFLAQSAQQFQETTGQPSPLHERATAAEQASIGRPGRPSPAQLIPGAIPLRAGERIGVENFAQLAAGFQPGDIGPLNFGGPNLGIGPEAVQQRARTLEGQGLSGFAAATQAVSDERGAFPSFNLADIGRVIGGGRGPDIGPNISAATAGEIALDPLNIAPATLIERGALAGAARAGGAAARQLSREGGEAAISAIRPRATVFAHTDDVTGGLVPGGLPEGPIR